MQPSSRNVVRKKNRKMSSARAVRNDRGRKRLAYLESLEVRLVLDAAAPPNNIFQAASAAYQKFADWQKTVNTAEQQNAQQADDLLSLVRQQYQQNATSFASFLQNNNRAGEQSILSADQQLGTLAVEIDNVLASADNADEKIRASTDG